MAVALLILATAFFVAAQFALVAVDRVRLEADVAAGSRRARGALAVLRRLSFHLSGAQLGVTVCSLILGFVAEPTIAQALHAPMVHVVGRRAAQGVAVALALALATVASMVLGELLPKGLVLARPVRAALSLATPLRVFSAAFGPLIRVANGAANTIVRGLGIEPREELTSARSVDELALLIRTSGEEGELDREEVTLLTRSLRFAEKTADDAMVPRVELVGVAADAPVSELVDAAVATGHSRFPVYGVDLDDIVGVAHVKDIFRLAPDERATAPVRDLVSAVVAVPETRPLHELLGDFQAAGAHLAVVVDEYGGTAGIVTLEDLLEEIVGEISDEYDLPPTALTQPGPGGSLVLPGGLHADEVFDASGYEMPDGPYETLAGFVLDRLGHLPEVGEWFEERGWLFRVSELERRRVASVTLLPPGVHDGSAGRPDTASGSAR